MYFFFEDFLYHSKFSTIIEEWIIIFTTTCGAHDKIYIAAVATSSGSNVGNDANASSEYVL